MGKPQSKLSDPPNGKSQTAPSAAMARQPCEKPGVLVVDEDHLVRIMVQLGLERNGFDVWLARNGRDAIDLYRRHTEEITVVLLDVRMPGLNGVQTLKALRELNPELPACFMIGDTDPYKPAELLQRGAAYVIAKPFLLDNLANIIRLITHGVSAELLSNGRVGKDEPGKKQHHGETKAHDPSR